MERANDAQRPAPRTEPVQLVQESLQLMTLGPNMAAGRGPESMTTEWMTVGPIGLLDGQRRRPRPGNQLTGQDGGPPTLPLAFGNGGPGGVMGLRGGFLNASQNRLDNESSSQMGSLCSDQSLGRVIGRGQHGASDVGRGIA